MDTLNQASFAAEPLSAERLLSKRNEGDRADNIRMEIAAEVVFTGMLQAARDENQLLKNKKGKENELSNPF